MSYLKPLPFLVLALVFPCLLMAADLTLLVIDGDSYLANQAVKGLEVPVDIKVISAGEIQPDDKKQIKAINQSKVIIVDVMGRELEEYLKNHIGFQGKTIYALRSSIDDEPLKKLGFIFDKQLGEYFSHLSVNNMRNMLLMAAHRHFDASLSFAPVQKQVQQGLYHPDAPEPFSSLQQYFQWLQARPNFSPKKPRVGLLFFSSSLTPGQEQPIRLLINQLEAAGFTPVPCFGKDQEVIENILLDNQGKAQVDLVVALSLKFYSALTDELAVLLDQLNVPIINAISLYQDTLDQWRQSPMGIGGSEVTWTIATPEISGLIEPTPLTAKKQVRDPDTGKSYYLSQPITENITRIITRIKKWLALQQMANHDKKIAIFFYNHHQGKQNIGASYLNVFASLENILSALAAEGYMVGNAPDKETIKQLIMTSARNIGSWAPGELENLLQSSQVLRLPIQQYKAWFKQLPQAFQEKVINQWGQPEDTPLMVDGDNFLIPAVQLGKLVLLPEPVRGLSDDPMKLYHDTTIFPHHQYLAVYLWLAHGFQADAMVHLGTHATYEWTPGKQAGLSPACSPEVLIADVPNLYPYIVDNLGEGIQAKRRGRGVMISHLTPPLKKAGLHQEYSRMAELINEYERAKARTSDTAPVKYAELMDLVESTGIMKDVTTESQQHHDAYHGAAVPPAQLHNEQDVQVHQLGHYLEEIKANLMPYGMHHFGRGMNTEAAAETAQSIIQHHPEKRTNDIITRLQDSGQAELTALLNGLDGRYVSPGQGNDPIRNPNALPTGKNFYGHSPQKLPTPAAWELGKRAAEQLIAEHIQTTQTYPNKVAVVLWATETLRNEGVNESTVLYLMGIRPTWSSGGRVTGVEVIPCRELGRPRIDVMVNASGLYRDLFPDKMLLIDQGVQLAIRQTDLDNLLRKNTAQLKQILQAQGMDEQAADEYSRLRIFSETPGSYGNGVSEMAAASGIWESEQEIVDVFSKRTSFAFGEKHWGLDAPQLLKEQLKGVDVALHSRSSNVYGLLDNDDFYQYLGGLSMAIRHLSGRTPKTMVTRQQQTGQVEVEDVAKTLGREIRSRYLNPHWIEGMKKEGYAGAREMANYVEYLWGWQVTTPEKIDAVKWQQSYEVYVEDKYDLGLQHFFNQASPWAHQSITSRMLESIRKAYWNPEKEVTQKLAATYAVSVVKKGVACCEHTCNNPLLNQMVVSIISLPGVLSPDMVEAFKIAIEKMAGASLDEQVEKRRHLQQQLSAPEQASAAQAAEMDTTASSEQNDSTVEGYKMEKMDTKDETTAMTSSGVEWLAGVVVLAFIGLAVLGAKRKNI
ncbi:cobaltochelatase subunit CobN [Desulfogranum marinum]|uniref:cobaltochelatase subunit CobN n=1 Tax=Desulfogranum marinum TaxID=453220 RepID=UPI0029C7B021|nr:cobaltochelatase subunit CobN [Desulfogranum marinum]